MNPLDRQPSDFTIASNLAERIAPTHGVVPAAVFADNKQPRCCSARAEVAFELRKQGWSLPRIGRALNRHHTSILSLLRSHAPSLGIAA